MKNIFIVVFLSLLFSKARAKSGYTSEPLLLARIAFVQGNTAGSINILNNWFDSTHPPRGRDADSAHLLLARAYEQQDDVNLASYHYTRVRVSNGAASEYAAFWEAKMDFARDRFAVAIAECKTFISDEDSPYYEDCLLITGESQAKLGYIRDAEQTFEIYLDGDEKNPRAEEISLIMAEAMLIKNPKKGLLQLKDLWLNHRYPTTDRRVLEHLNEHGMIPEVRNQVELRQRVGSLSRTARFAESWQLYTEYAADHPNEITEDWMRQHHVHIAWSARQYLPYAEARMAEYDLSPSGNLAWKIYSAYAKAGDWVSAAAWAREGLEKYGGTGRWYRASDELARAEMFNGNYVEAAAEWDKLNGSTSDFYSAFCYYMSGDHTRAIQAFDENLPRANEWETASLYWRSKAFRKLGQFESAMMDESTIMAKEGQDWYKILLEQSIQPSAGDDLRRGLWTGNRLVTTQEDVTHYPVNLDTMEWQYSPRRQTFKARKNFDWSLQHSETETVSKPISTARVSHPYIGQLPDSYNTLLWGADHELSKMFRKFADKHKQLFPEFETIYILRMGGHFPEAARMLSSFYEEWKKGVRGKLSVEKNRQFRKLDLTANHWRSFFVFVRGHHYGYRYHTDFQSEEIENQGEIDRLVYPIVRADNIWDHAYEYDIDPYLMHGLLRTESAYQEFVVSWAGAIGYIQVMPQTGAKVAYLLNEDRYSANDLYEPKINLRYGMFYFSKLMERFDNAFPLAVGSYNGGPHNMSRWLRPIKHRTDLDEFVEHVPYNETRIYIKKVVSSYAEYLNRYEGPEARIILPSLPKKDDPEVINF